MAFQLSDAEWNILFDEPHEALKAYCAIRRYMDYTTGIAGIVRRISEQYISEVLSIPSKPGRPSEKCTRKKARYWVEHLERLGLLVRKGCMVFECQHATRDNPSKRGGAIPGAMNRAINNGKAGPSSRPSDLAASSEFTSPIRAIKKDEVQQEVGVEVGPTSGISGNNINTHTHNARARNSSVVYFDQFSNKPAPEQLPPDPGPDPEPDNQAQTIPDPPPRRRKFAMYADWEPDSDQLQYQMTVMSVKSRVTPEEVAEFRCYWVDEPGRELTEGQWIGKLLNNVKRNRLATTGGGSYGTGHRHDKSKTKSSKRDSVTQATRRDATKFTMEEWCHGQEDSYEFYQQYQQTDTQCIDTTWETIN